METSASLPLAPQQVDSLQHSGAHLSSLLQSHSAFFVPQQSVGQLSTVSPGSHLKLKHVSGVSTDLFDLDSHFFTKHFENAQHNPGILYTDRQPVDTLY